MKTMEETLEAPLIYVPISPIEKYNHFICTYNNDLNHNVKLECLKKKVFFLFLFDRKKTLEKIIFYLMFTLISGFNILLLILIMRDFSNMLCNMKIYNENRKKTKNPFQNMVYSPSLCQMVGKSDHNFSIEFQG